MTPESKIRMPTKLVAAVLGIAGIVVVLFAAVALVRYISKSAINTALEKPIERLNIVEGHTQKIPNLEQAQRDTEKRIIKLQTTLDVYLENQPIDKKTAENITGRAVDKALNTKDPIEKGTALYVAGEILEKATSHHVVLGSKKVSQHGLALLQQGIQPSEEPSYETVLARLAKQRTLIFPPPTAPSNQAASFIIGKEQVLDGTSFTNVTFVDCTIVYNDGWLSLENVRFINCNFNVSLVAGKHLYQALFESEEAIPQVSVKSPGKGPDATPSAK